MYQAIIDGITGHVSPAIRRVADGAIIPFDEKNADYQEYISWLNAGNTPIPAG